MNAPGSPTERNDSVARCIAAGHPSVRSRRRSASDSLSAASRGAGEERTRFLRAEAQVGGTELAELVARPQAREGQRRVLA